MEEIIVHTNYFSGTEHAHNLYAITVLVGILALGLLIISS